MFLVIACAGIILTILLTNRSFTAVSVVLAIFACFALMFASNNALPFVIALEGYNLCYILFLFINRTNRKTIRRLLLLSMLVLSIMIFGLCNLKIYTASTLAELLILIGLLFKLGIVPFHTWILDVYDHASFRIIAVTDGIMKVSLATIFMYKIPYINTIILPILHIFGFFSLAVGAIMALHTHNIRRWLGCLSIGHAGIIMCCASVQSSVPTAALLYLLSYSTCTIVFCISKYNLLKVTMLCAMVGLPPFHTFFTKINLIKELLSSSNTYTLLVIMLYFIFELISVIRWIMYYYKIGNEDLYQKLTNL